MKKLLILLGIGCAAGSTQAYHIDLSPHTKCTFAQKRLEMMRAHLLSSKEELALLEGSLHVEIEHFPATKPRIATLKKEITELESSIPVMEKSLQALCETTK